MIWRIEKHGGNNNHPIAIMQGCKGIIMTGYWLKCEIQWSKQEENIPEEVLSSWNNERLYVLLTLTKSKLELLSYQSLYNA